MAQPTRLQVVQFSIYLHIRITHICDSPLEVDRSNKYYDDCQFNIQTFKDYCVVCVWHWIILINDLSVRVLLPQERMCFNIYR